MHFTQTLYLLLPALVSAAASTKVLSACGTRYGSSSVASVPTGHASETVTFRGTVKTTVTPVKTVTPPASTSTQTVTVISTAVTTLPQVTGTFTTTSTTLSTTTSTFQTTVTTITTSTTVTTTTSTISGSGFVPLASELASMGDTYAKRNVDQLRKRALGEPMLLAQRDGPRQGRLHPTSGRRYPTKVQCNTLTEVFTTSTLTSTATSTRTTTISPATNTVTATTTLTTTSTVLQTPATATVTSTVTSTVTASTTNTNTITTTTTTTSTITAATPINAMCQPNNLISTINGSPIEDGAVASGITQTTAVDATDCCNQCYIAGNQCSGFFYETDTQYAGTCYLFIASDTSTCNPNANAGTAYYGNAFSGQFTYTAGNSYCGQFGSIQNDS